MKERLNEEETDWTLARVVGIVRLYKNLVVRSEGKGPLQRRMNMREHKTNVSEIIMC
jgi:hypothetical protein